MRGKGFFHFSHEVLEGITPRMREKQLAARCNDMNGITPRMRGKVHVQNTAQNVVGITPAYAGEKLSTAFGTIVDKGSPRVCGEKQTV